MLASDEAINLRVNSDLPHAVVEVEDSAAILLYSEFPVNIGLLNISYILKETLCPIEAQNPHTARLQVVLDLALQVLEPLCGLQVR